jgi:hypothetical protein
MFKRVVVTRRIVFYSIRFYTIVGDYMVLNEKREMLSNRIDAFLSVAYDKVWELPNEIVDEYEKQLKDLERKPRKSLKDLILFT